MSFSHLHVHSKFSAADAIADPNDIAEQASKYKMSACAITDHGTMAGIVSFYNACKEYEIKPIYGIETYIDYWDDRLPSPPRTPTSHLILLAKNKTGLNNLMQMTREAYNKNNLQVFSMETIAKYKDGIIATSACLYGFTATMACRHMHMLEKLPANPDVYSETLRIDPYNNEYQKATGKFIKIMKELFNEDFYLEIQDHELQEQKLFNTEIAPEIAETFGLKMVPTNDVHYINPGEGLAHGLLMAIRRRKRDSVRFKPSTQSHFKSEEEMLKLFDQDTLNITKEIVSKVKNNLFSIKKYNPKFDTDARPSEDYLRDKAWAGFLSKYGPLTSAERREQLQYELDIITSLDFSDYMLIVQDIIEQTTIRSGRKPGPGRGSAGGSLLAYVLGITEIDPIRHDLRFSRFLSPARCSPKIPDFGLPK